MKSAKLLSWEVGFLPFLMGCICGTAIGVGLYSETLRHDRQQVYNEAQKQKAELNEETRLLKAQLEEDVQRIAAELNKRSEDQLAEQEAVFRGRLTGAKACSSRQDELDKLAAYALTQENEVDTVRRTFGSALGECSDKLREMKRGQSR